MIYQHRLVVSAPGRIDQRNASFQGDVRATLDAHGSRLVGAWEALSGDQVGASIWQIRQFDDLNTWQAHQSRVGADPGYAQNRETLMVNVDFCDTSILREHTGLERLQKELVAASATHGNPAAHAGMPAARSTALYEQRVIWLRPATTREHQQFYSSEVVPALECEGARLVAYFDTVIGPGTTNAHSHRSVELRRFPSAQAWQRWHETLLDDPVRRRLVREIWPARVVRTDGVLLRPTAYSLMQ